MKIFKLLLLSISLTLFAQEAKYKAVLDSIAKYIQFTRFDDEMHKVKLLTHYNAHEGRVFVSMTSNSRTKIVFTNGNEIYMADLKAMDTSMVGLGRGIRLYDSKGKVKFKKSASIRIENGKHGGIETEYILLKMQYTEENKIIAQKLLRFFKEAILYSKKVTTKKSDYRNVEEMEYD